MENGISFPSNLQRPNKGDILHAFIISTKEWGAHHANPQDLKKKWLQMPNDDQQTWPPYHISGIYWKYLDIEIPLLLRLLDVDIFPATANQQKDSTLGGAKPNHKSMEDDQLKLDPRSRRKIWLRNSLMG